MIKFYYRFLFCCSGVFVLILNVCHAQVNKKVRAEEQSAFNKFVVSSPGAKQIANCQLPTANYFPFRETSSQSDFDIIYDRCEWRVDPAIDSIHGAVTTYFKVMASTLDTISLDLSSSLIVDSVVSHQALLAFVHSADDKLSIVLSSTLSQGNIDSISIYYEGIPPSSGFGSFIQANHNGTPIIWTLSEPYGAKDWWPCKNGLSDKVDSMDIIITCPQQYRAASNGLLVSEITTGSDKIYHWKHRYPIATYLVCMAVTNYAAYSDYVPFGSDSVEVLNYVYPEDSADVRVITPQLIPVMQLYDTLFGLYPFANEKYGMAEFGWGGGMEHQTMTFLGGYGVDIMAHELAHHWFGDKITCGSWQDIWLNEGFAVFCQMYIHKRLQIDPGRWKVYLTSNLSNATSIQDGSVDCRDTTSVGRIFSTNLTYSKGGVVLNQLRWILGDSAFFNGIRSYLADTSLAYHFAHTDDLKRHFETASSKNLDYYFNDWFYGAGFPIYDIAWRQNENKSVEVHVHQTQADPSVSYFRLPLPVELKGTGGDTILVFDNTHEGEVFTASLPFTVDSMIFDPDQNLVSARNYVHAYIGEVSPENGLTVFPNPANKEVLIYTAALNGKITVTLLDGLGKIILEKDYFVGPTNNAIRLQTSDLDKGCYFLKIISGDRVINRSMIIAR